MNNALQIQVRKPKTFKRHFEFFSGDKELAVLDYKNSFCKQATAISDDRKWILNRKGFWKPTLEISAEQSPYTKSSLPYKWNFKTNFRTESGKELMLKKTSNWKNTWAWIDRDNNPVIEIKSCQLKKNNRGIVNVLPGYLSQNESILLTIIAWYQIIASEEQAGAAVAAAVS